MNLLSLPIAASISSYFLQSNLAGQLIVLVLLGLSILTWTVMISKYLNFKRFEELNQSCLSHINRDPTLATLKSSPSASSPYASLLNKYAEIQSTPRSNASSNTIETLDLLLGQEVARLSSLYESRLSLLGTIVTAAPIFGLLGTVWGVMDAFGAIAIHHNATLAQLAPGVSAALLTTVAGLCVALPAIFGYNTLTAMSKRMILDLENFAASLVEQTN